MSQKILQFIEVDLDYCSLTYGVAPCQASLTSSPPTGTIKCFNTPVTCQDRDNFTNAPVTMRFAFPTSYIPASIECIPSINSIDFDPAAISLGKDLGVRATLTISFDDHRHSDTGAGFDKYLADRPYDPYNQGTFWGKFAARHPFVRGRNLRWITGTADQALADMETRHFIIDSITGPTNSGVFKVIAKDLLKLADGDRAMAPTVSNGFLVANITDVATKLTLSPAGVGTEYPATGYVAIGGTEIVSYVKGTDSPAAGDVFTIVRGQLGTTASDHNAQDRVQIVLRYDGQSPELIINDLLTTYSGVDPIYIPLTDWSDEVEAYLRRVYTATIAQPTAVNTLISELIEQAGLSMWWDDRNQEIGLLVLRGLIYSTFLFSEENMMLDTLDVSDQPDKRISQVHTYFGQINPLTSLTDKANYRSVSIISDAQSETDYGSAMIQEIFSRWIPALGRSVADRLGTIIIGRFKDPPRKLKFSILRNSIPEVELGKGYQIEAWPLQQATGEAETVNLQVTRLKAAPDLIEVETEEVTYTAQEEDLSTRRIDVDANNYNINLRNAHDDIYPAPESGITIIFTVSVGAIVGSTSTAAYSVDIGSWPDGVDIIVHVAGRVQGHGGHGGGAGSISAGENGGPAFFTRYPIKLSSPGGQIWAGGGGGARASYVDGTGNLYVWGGGGGAGFDGGVGGNTNSQAGPDPGGSGTTEAGGVAVGYAGDGGGPALPGKNASIGGGSHGNGGIAIDGISFITTGSWDGTTFTPGALGADVRGTQIN